MKGRRDDSGSLTLELGKDGIEIEGRRSRDMDLMKGIGGREAGWSGGGGSGHKGIFYERHGEVEVEMIMVRRKAARWGKPPRIPPGRARTRRVPLSSSTTSNDLLDLENVSLEGTRPHHLSPIPLHQLSSARFWSTACLDPLSPCSPLGTHNHSPSARLSVSTYRQSLLVGPSHWSLGA